MAIAAAATAGCASDAPLGQCVQGTCSNADAGHLTRKDAATAADGGTAGHGGSSDASTAGDGAAASGCATGKVCAESWLCTPWTTNGSSNEGTRSCVDQCKCTNTTPAHPKPVEAATLPALDFGYYQCNVEPLLDKFCAQLGCHGTEHGRAFRIYARGRLRHKGESLSAVCQGENAPTTDKCVGSVECACDQQPHTQAELRMNFDAARGLLLDDQGKPLTTIDDSGLLKQPLSGGGLAHAGIHIFRPNDSNYTKLRTWLGKAAVTCAGDTN
jgi:hypothetical protein